MYPGLKVYVQVYTVRGREGIHRDGKRGEGGGEMEGGERRGQREGKERRRGVGREGKRERKNERE